MADEGFLEFLLEYVCAYKYPMSIMLGFCLTLIVAMGISLTVVESGSAGHAIAIANVIGLGAIAAFLALLLNKCRQLP